MCADVTAVGSTLPLKLLLYFLKLAQRVVSLLQDRAELFFALLALTL